MRQKLQNASNRDREMGNKEARLAAALSTMDYDLQVLYLLLMYS